MRESAVRAAALESLEQLHRSMGVGCTTVHTSPPPYSPLPAVEAPAPPPAEVVFTPAVDSVVWSGSPVTAVEYTARMPAARICDGDSPTVSRAPTTARRTGGRGGKGGIAADGNVLDVELSLSDDDEDGDDACARVEGAAGCANRVPTPAVDARELGVSCSAAAVAITTIGYRSASSRWAGSDVIRSDKARSRSIARDNRSAVASASAVAPVEAACESIFPLSLRRDFNLDRGEPLVSPSSSPSPSSPSSSDAASPSSSSPSSSPKDDRSACDRC